MITGIEKAMVGDGSLGDAFVELLRRFNLPYGVLVILPKMTGGNVLRCAEGVLEAYSAGPAVVSVGCDEVMQAFAAEMGQVVGDALDDPVNARRITLAADRVYLEGN